MSAAPRISLRSTDAPGAVSLRWVLGNRGSLSVETAPEGSELAARCELRIPGSPTTVRHVPLTIEEASDTELRLAGPDGVFLHIVTRDAAPLVLTNLPEALGLRGGTYALAEPRQTPRQVL